MKVSYRMKNIEDKIICEYTDKCKSYSELIGDGNYSKCVTCRNNTYVDSEDLKKDYYKPNKAELIENLFIFLLGFIVVIAFLAIILTPGI